MRLEDCKAIVTGGLSGLGEATVRAIVDAGGKAAVLDCSEKHISEYEQLGIPVFKGDIRNTDDVENAIKGAAEAFGFVNTVINCAGIAYGCRVFGKNGPHTLEDFERVININLIGTFNVIRLAAKEIANAPVVEDGERGVIINTASFAAYEGQIGQAAYSASKGGIVGMTLPIARELARFGIRCNTVAPGTMETPMGNNLPPKALDGLLAAAIFPARLGKPEEFASIILEMIRNKFLNGTVIRLDGAVRLPPR